MRKIWMLLLLVLVLTGCKTISDFKPDTIVDIPLHPTQAPTEVPTETQPTQPTPPPETETVTEATEPTEDTTEPPRNNGSSGNNPGKQNTGTSETPVTEAPTDPPTQPVTEPPTQLPTQPATEPPTQLPTQLAAEPSGHDPSGYTPGSLDRGIADAVNAQRQAAGLSALTLDTRLCAIASVRAYETSIVWNHTRPDGTAGITVLNQYGYSYSHAAENLYFGAAGAGTIVDKWMSSEARGNNILSEAAVSIGVGSYTSADGLIYVAAVFVG